MKRIKTGWRVYKEAFQYDKKGMVMMFIHEVSQLVSRVMLFMLPAFLIGLYKQDITLSIALLSVTFYIASMAILNSITAYTDKIVAVFWLTYRAYKGFQLSTMSYRIPFEEYESDAYRKKIQQIEARSVESNADGFEGLLRESSMTIGILLNVIVYIALLQDTGVWVRISVILLTILQVLIYLSFEKKRIRVKEEVALEQKKKNYLDATCSDIKNGKDIRMYGISNWFSNLYTQNGEAYEGKIKEEARIDLLSGVLRTLLLAVQMIFIYQVVFGQLENGMSSEQFLVIVGASSGLCALSSELVKHFAKTRIDADGCATYYQYVDAITYEDEGNCVVPKIHGDIRFENVSFRYIGSDHDTLHDFNLHIKPNEQVALVGNNGAGKTTLVKLLCGLYEPTSGRILVDGVDIQTYSKQVQFAMFGVVFQDSIFSEYTIEENIASGEHRDENRMEEVLTQANIMDKVKALPKGSKTTMGRMFDDEGQYFSGGELQKFALARVLYKDAPILLLDEPTAALDPLAEKELYEAYAALTKDKTSLFISHRLSSTQFCDRVLYMEDGKIVEEGTHEELMRYDNGYSSMFHIQAKYYVKGGNADEEDMENTIMDEQIRT